MRHIPRRWFVLVITLLLLIAGAVSMSTAQMPPPDTPTLPYPTATPMLFAQVVVAVQAIPRGLKIPRLALATVVWPVQSIPQRAMTNIDDVVGKMARTDIFVEQPILDTIITDDYSELASIDPSSAPAQLLKPGAAVQGEIDSKGRWYQHWTFDGKAKETISISMQGKQGLKPYLLIWNVTTEAPVEGIGAFTDTAYTLAVVLPDTDTYMIMATRRGLYEGQSQGAYCLIAVKGDHAGAC